MLLFSLAERGPYTAKILHFRKNRNFKDFVKIILRIIQKKVWQGNTFKILGGKFFAMRPRYTQKLQKFSDAKFPNMVQCMSEKENASNE